MNTKTLTIALRKHLPLFSRRAARRVSHALAVLVPLTAVALMPLRAAAQAEPELGTEEQREAGRAIYMEKCAQCHGDTGAGDGIAAPFMRPVPRDFTAGIYKVRTTPSGQLPTDDDLRRIIREGMPYTGMPAWPSLSSRQITNLVYYIKTFNDDFSGPYGVPDVIDVPSAPRFSAESAERGRIVYEENQCSDCHGNVGRGDGPSAPTLQDQWDNHIRPADLTKRWTFIGGASREDIYRTFTTGLDGSPMPSYTIDPVEDRWALVDYVHSLSRDEPEYATLVIAHPLEGEIDVTRGKELFDDGRGAYFPVVGQVIEPGRAYMPAADGVEVKAVFNDEEIAIMLLWHDMKAETTGSNSPDMEVPRIEQVVRDTMASPYSDAVAVQLPSAPPDGVEKPYFMFGDANRSVDLWFADLAADSAQVYIGRGSADIQSTQDTLDFHAEYNDGEWMAVFKRSRRGLFEEGTFVPIAFSLWDGFNEERGNRRGLTSWFHLYVEPLDRPSAILPMVRAGVLTLLVLLGVVGLVRWRHRRPTAAA